MKSPGRLLPILSALFLLSQPLSAADPAMDSVRLMLNWKAEPEFGGFFAAQQQGIFTKHRLKVEILPGGSGIPTTQLVAAKQVEFGISSGDTVVISRAKQADVVALFAVYQTYPQGLMVHEESNITDMRAVFNSGLTVAINRGLPQYNFLEKKFSFKNAKIVPYAGGISAFLSNKRFAQQCFVTSEPLLARRHQAKVKTFLAADEGYNPYTTLLVTHGERIRKNEDLVRRMVSAVREGWEAYLADPTATNRYMFEKQNDTIAFEEYQEIAQAQRPFIFGTSSSPGKPTKKLPLGQMNKERWQTLCDQLYDLKVISTKPDVPKIFVNY